MGGATKWTTPFYSNNIRTHEKQEPCQTPQIIASSIVYPSFTIWNKVGGQSVDDIIERDEIAFGQRRRGYIHR
jgi:hypothetical protein